LPVHYQRAAASRAIQRRMCVSSKFGVSLFRSAVIAPTVVALASIVHGPVRNAFVECDASRVRSQVHRRLLEGMRLRWDGCEVGRAARVGVLSSPP